LRRMFDWRMILIAFFGIVGEVANQTSIILAGSLTFTVVYSCVTIWTAIFGIPLLHVRPNAVQWGALSIIVLGLLGSAISHTAAKAKSSLIFQDHGPQLLYDGSAGSESQPVEDLMEAALPITGMAEATEATSLDFLIGAGCGLVGSVSFALMYVFTEQVQRAADAPPPVALCSFTGLVGTMVVGTYVAIWDGPRWAFLVTDELHKDYSQIAGVYGVIVLCSFLHNLGFCAAFSQLAKRRRSAVANLSACCIAACRALPVLACLPCRLPHQDVSCDGRDQQGSAICQRLRRVLVSTNRSGRNARNHGFTNWGWESLCDSRVDACSRTASGWLLRVLACYVYLHALVPCQLNATHPSRYLYCEVDPQQCMVGERFPLNTGCLPLSYSGNPGVNGVSDRDGNRKRETLGADSQQSRRHGVGRDGRHSLLVWEGERSLPPMSIPARYALHAL
jgi:drug/metabolite transporter (DMT)-like permease